MKKIVFLICAFFITCGFESLSDQSEVFEIENKTPNFWEIEQAGSVVKAYNEQTQMELTIYTATFMPNSPQCLSNKHIKDIKFDIDIYKKAQKGDQSWVKMVDRMKISFIGRGYSEEKNIYGSNLIKNDLIFNLDDVVHIGTLQFLMPYPCKDIDGLKMRIGNIMVRGRTLPPLELLFKTKES